MENKPTIIIADDHDLFREALKIMLEADEIANIIGEASNGKQLIELLLQDTPDIILMDIEMPGMNGIEATRKIIESNPDQKILVLTMFGDQHYYFQMIEAGARGFILKSCNKNELEEAVRMVHEGQSYFSNELLRKLVVKLSSKKMLGSGKDVVEFSDQETNILKYMCQGFSTNEIANKVHLSAKTIENYRVKLLQKTNCKNSVSLVVYAIKNQIIEI